MSTSVKQKKSLIESAADKRDSAMKIGKFVLYDPERKRPNELSGGNKAMLGYLKKNSDVVYDVNNYVAGTKKNVKALLKYIENHPTGHAKVLDSMLVGLGDFDGKMIKDKRCRIVCDRLDAQSKSGMNAFPFDVLDSLNELLMKYKIESVKKEEAKVKSVRGAAKKSPEEAFKSVLEKVKGKDGKGVDVSKLSGKTGTGARTKALPKKQSRSNLRQFEVSGVVILTPNKVKAEVAYKLAKGKDMPDAVWAKAQSKHKDAKDKAKEDSVKSRKEAAKRAAAKRKSASSRSNKSSSSTRSTKSAKAKSPKKTKAKTTKGKGKK